MTANQLIPQLPEPIRTEFIEAQAAQKRDPDVDIYFSISGLILGGIMWKETLQGHDYWSSVHSRAHRGEFDPKEPQP